MTTGDSNAPDYKASQVPGIDNEVIRLTRNGVWLSDNTEIDHEPTRRLFAKILKKDTQGYFLAIGRETKRIIVEDTAYFVHRIDGDHSHGFTLWLNDETQEELLPQTLSYVPGRLTCRIKNGTEEAKFLHAPYFEILSELIEHDGSYWIVIGGEQVRLAPSAVHFHD